MKKPVLWLTWFVAALMVACASQKEPASKAVAEVEASINALRDDAAKFAATELQQVESALGSLKDQLTTGDYKEVLAAAPGLAGQVASLRQTVDAQKAEWEAAVAAATQEWQTLSADVPKMVEAIQSRVDILGKSRKWPKNLRADAVQTAKDGLESMKTTWSEASALFSSGNAVDAVSKANAAKEKGNEVLKLLGMASAPTSRTGGGSSKG